jgi:hypothetical protein
MRNRTIGQRIRTFLSAPLRFVDDWASQATAGLSETDLIADLDPGWLEWRESLTDQAVTHQAA